MRALVISTVVGAAVVLSGCQTTGNNLGGVEYDKAALGTLMVQQLVMVFLNQMQTLAVKTTVLRQLVQFLVVLVVYTLIRKRKITSTNGGYWCRRWP